MTMFRNGPEWYCTDGCGERVGSQDAQCVSCAMAGDVQRDCPSCDDRLPASHFGSYPASPYESVDRTVCDRCAHEARVDRAAA